METIELTDDLKDLEPYKFTKLDRCDACGSAQAYVRAIKGFKDLMFCMHHFNNHMSELVSQGWNIDNQTQQLFDEVASMKKASDDNF